MVKNFLTKGSVELLAMLGRWLRAAIFSETLVPFPFKLPRQNTVLVIDAGAGKLVRVGPDGVRTISPALGMDVSEASLPE